MKPFQGPTGNFPESFRPDLRGSDERFHGDGSAFLDGSAKRAPGWRLKDVHESDRKGPGQARVQMQRAPPNAHPFEKGESGMRTVTLSVSREQEASTSHR